MKRFKIMSKLPGSSLPTSSPYSGHESVLSVVVGFEIVTYLLFNITIVTLFALGHESINLLLKLVASTKCKIAMTRY